MDEVFGKDRLPAREASALIHLERLPSVTDDLPRADIILGIRGGLQDNASPQDLLDYDRQVLDLGLRAHSEFHIGEALTSRIVDLIRAGRLGDRWGAKTVSCALTCGVWATWVLSCRVPVSGEPAGEYLAGLPAMDLHLLSGGAVGRTSAGP
jgi:hypothetical protein